MDQIQQTVQYLAQCDAETRDALVAIAIAGENTAFHEQNHSAVNAVLVIRNQPMAVATALLALNGTPKRGRPRGSKTRKAAA